MILALNNISKSFGTDVILKNVSFNIEEKDKVAIVGVNGAGKSTLFKIITGELSHDDGEVICPKTTTIGYFSQTLEVDSSKTIYGELLTVFEPIMALEQEMRDIEVKMASSSGTALDDLMKKYSDLSASEEDNIKNINEYLDGVTPVDAYNALKAHKDEDIFKRTDHHWSQLGAYYAAEEFAKTAGVPYASLSKYEKVTKHGYVGTLYGYSQDTDPLIWPFSSKRTVFVADVPTSIPIR